MISRRLVICFRAEGGNLASQQAGGVGVDGWTWFWFAMPTWLMVFQRELLSVLNTIPLKNVVVFFFKSHAGAQ